MVGRSSYFILIIRMNAKCARIENACDANLIELAGKNGVEGGRYEWNVQWCKKWRCGATGGFRFGSEGVTFAPTIRSFFVRELARPSVGPASVCFDVLLQLTD